MKPMDLMLNPYGYLEDVEGILKFVSEKVMSKFSLNTCIFTMLRVENKLTNSNKVSVR